MSNFDTIRAELQTAKTLNKGDVLNKIPDSVDNLGLRDVAVLSKLGYQHLEDGAAFGAALKRNPNLNGVISQIQNLAVPTSGNGIVTSGGQPVPTKYDGLMRSIGDRFRSNDKLLDQLSADFKENPGVEKRFLEAVQKNPDAVAKSLRSYTGAEGQGSKVNGQLEVAINSIIGAPATPSVKQASVEKPAAGSSSPKRPEKPAAPARPAPIETAAETSKKVETPAPTVKTEVMADDTANGKITISANDIGRQGGLADQLSDKLLKVFPDKEVAIEGFRQTLKTNKDLQQQVAQNLTNNPDFVTKLMEMSKDGKDSSADKLLQKYGRGTIDDLLAHPEKLAQDKYVDGLTSQLSAGSGLGGMLSKMGDMFGMDFSKMFEGLAPFVEKMMLAAKELFSSFKDGNFLGMGNGKDLFSGFQNGISKLTDEPKGNAQKTSVGPTNGEVRVPVSEAEHKAGLPGAPPPQQAPQQTASNNTPKPGGTEMQPSASLFSGTSMT